MKKQIFIGLACLTAGIGLAGCGASNNQPVETTTSETTTAETTTTTAETTTTTAETTTAETTTTTEAPTTTATEAPTTTAKAHPEDDQIMENLRNFYKSHDKEDGLPVNNEHDITYLKYAIADFDADGVNEVAIEFQPPQFTNPDLSLYKSGVTDYDYPFYNTYGADFSELTFLDNGVAYCKTTNDMGIGGGALDDKMYYLIGDEILPKLNYNKSLLEEYTHLRRLYYTSENGKIMKNLYSAHDYIFEPLEKTQEQYETEKAILNSGNVIDLQVKDFTAENLGL